MDDDITLQIEGSSQKAETAIDRIIEKLNNLQSSIEKMAPSLSQFSKQMDSIASSSKAFATLDKLAKSTGSVSTASKKAEANEALYQARLDRANVSMERSREQSERLANARAKLAEADNMQQRNNATFSMPANEFANKYTGKNNAETEWEEPEQSVTNGSPFISGIDAFMPESSKTVKMNIDASPAINSLDKIGAHIDELRPKISGASEETQTDFENIAQKLLLTSQQIDNQSNLYHNLAQQSGEVTREAGEGSEAYLRLEKRMLSAASSADRLIDKQRELALQLDNIASEAGGAGDSMEALGTRSVAASTKSSNGWYQMWNMFYKMLIRIAAFRFFSAIQQGITTGLNDIAIASDKANSAMSALSTSSLYLKNSVASALMPAIQALAPVITWLSNELAQLFNTIGMIIARLSGASTVTIAKSAAVDYAATIDTVGKKATSTSKKVKELQNTVMGFDELNVLSEPTSNNTGNSSSSTGKAGMPAYGDMFKTVQIPTGIQSSVDKIKAVISDNISTIKRLLIGAPLVIGAVLAFSGHPAIGIALMAVGAKGLAKQGQEDWSYLTSKTTSSLDKLKRVLNITGTIELAIGAVLAFSGVNAGLGIALMAGGVATTMASMDWSKLDKNTQKAINGISFGSAAAMLSLGAVLAFSGANILVGVGLMIGGITASAASSLNWNSMDIQLRKTLSQLAAIVGTFMLVIGVMLAFSGPQNLPLGIGLIVGGLLAGASGAALDWDYVKTQLESQLSDILAAVGMFLLVIGLIITFTNPLATPLGVGLIIAGGASLAGSVAINWNYIRDKIGEALEGVKGKWNEFTSGWNSWGPVRWWNDNVAPWFTWEKWHSLGQRAIDAITYPFRNIHWPSIHFPTIKWVGGGWQSSGWIYNVLNALHLPTSLPRLEVGWYAKGGIFDNPSLIGVGEAGPEAVLPLNDNSFAKIAKGIVDSNNSQRQESNSSDEISEKYDALRDAFKELSKAILDRPVNLYANDRKIAESANRGNKQIAYSYHMAT